jgi:hypothetical protein
MLNRPAPAPLIVPELFPDALPPPFVKACRSMAIVPAFVLVALTPAVTLLATVPPAVTVPVLVLVTVTVPPTFVSPALKGPTWAPVLVQLLSMPVVVQTNCACAGADASADRGGQRACSSGTQQGRAADHRANPQSLLATASAFPNILCSEISRANGRTRFMQEMRCANNNNSRWSVDCRSSVAIPQRERVSLLHTTQGRCA